MKYQCSFCGYASDEIDDFEMDEQYHTGFWCLDCDGFTYFENVKQQHTFHLIYEKKGKNEKRMSVKPDFPTQVSPLRWPGGKSRFIGSILERCNPEKMVHFIEPFAGGASVGLSLLLAGKIQDLYLNDLDFGIYSLFQVIKTCPWMLLDRIENFTPSEKEYRKAQSILKNGYDGIDIIDAAWNLLIVNRLAFSGIPKANCMSDPAARWNPKTLQKRIHAIHEKADNLYVSCMDACEYIEEMYWMDQATIFLDPPYYVKGPDLYLENFQNQDHERLACLLEALYQGIPGADMLLTYDDSNYIRSLYRFPAEEMVQRNYCI